jgi:peptidoglycan/LPS O-acetylase OafA/YrhL
MRRGLDGGIRSDKLTARNRRGGAACYAAALPRMEHSDGLQALRGVLALLVFVQHVCFLSCALVPHPPNALFLAGTLAVQVFFALSGYLMATKAGDPPARFAADRVRRIVPALWLSVGAAATLMNGWTIPIRNLPWDILLLVPTGRPNYLPTPHWSLYYECFFYLLVFLIARLRVSWVRPGIVIWGVVSFVAYTRVTTPVSSAAPSLYDLVFPEYALYFAAGVLAGWRFVPRREHSIAYAIAAALFLAPGLSFALRHQEMTTIPLAIGALCAVRAGASWQARSIAARALKVVGDASYGFYLIHIVIMLIVIGWVMPRFHFSSYLGATIVVALLTFPPAFAFGLFDTALQRVLKRMQTFLRSPRPFPPVVADEPAS